MKRAASLESVKSPQLETRAPCFAARRRKWHEFSGRTPLVAIILGVLALAATECHGSQPALSPEDLHQPQFWTPPELTSLTNASPSVIESMIQRYRASAARGEPKGQLGLATLYGRGLGVRRDLTEAVRWCRLAAGSGLPEAQHQLGVCLSEEKGSPTNSLEAVEWFRKAAAQDFAPAQYQLGHAYAYGDGVPRDFDEANRWYRRAAEKGFIPAMHNFAMSCVHGRGMPTNINEAIHWLNLAAEKDCARSQVALGLLLGAPPFGLNDNAGARKWMGRAAEMGDPQGELAYGLMLYDGVGAAPDRAQGLKWIGRSAESGFPEAQFALGDKLAKQGEVPEALRWLTRAAEASHPVAQNNLGLWTVTGPGWEPTTPRPGVGLSARAGKVNHGRCSTWRGFITRVGACPKMTARISSGRRRPPNWVWPKRSIWPVFSY